MTKTIQLLRDMIAIPSVNPMVADTGEPVERALANFIETILSRAGIDCERQKVAEGRDNVIAIVHASSSNARFVVQAISRKHIPGMNL